MIHAWYRDAIDSCGCIFGMGLLWISVAGVAQLVELQPSKLDVASSNLVSRSRIHPEMRVVFTSTMDT